MLTVTIDISEAQKYMSIKEIEDFNNLSANDTVSQFYITHTNEPVLYIKVIQNSIDDSSIIWYKETVISRKDFKSIVLRYLKEVKDV